MYRPEIDGLRTIAVLPVILFHAGISVFSGGFVGVDVFFVISGYLITGIILRELGEGRFSVLRFYERRARRILPALFVVVLSTIPFMFAWATPPQFEAFSKSVLSVALFASNILFWRESDYFGPASEEKPLLHTWSLAVEEQYYVIFPLLLLLGWRLGRHRLAMFVLAGALASLLLSEWASRALPSANFYLLPTRAWELLAGALCAFLSVGAAQRRSGLLAALGLAMILLAVFAFDGSTPFPSVYALLPVVGACLVILFAAPGTAVARLLSSAPFVGIGLISYSAYLWHQPILALIRIRSPLEPTPALLGGAVLLTFVLAYLSWRFVEQPFRHAPTSLLPTRRSVFAASGAGLALMVAFGLAVTGAQGLPQRFPKEALASLKLAETDRNPYRRNCHYQVDNGGALPSLPNPRCVFGQAEDGRRAILIGDSHADAVAYPITQALIARGYSVEQATVTGCVPFPGFTRVGRPCDAANQRIFAYIAETGFDLVLVAMRPAVMLYDGGFDNGEGGVEAEPDFKVIYDADALGLPETASKPEKLARLYAQGLTALIDTGASMILIYPIPEAGWNVPELAFRTILQDGNTAPTLSTSYARYIERNRPFFEILDSIQLPGLFRVRPDQILCDTMVPERCANVVDGRILYGDDDHLTVSGAQLLVPAVLSQVAEIEATHVTRAH